MTAIEGRSAEGGTMSMYETRQKKRRGTGPKKNGHERRGRFSTQREKLCHENPEEKMPYF